MKSLRLILNAIVLVLGLYMIVTFGKGAMNPPMISGIAFVLLGLVGLLRK